jgi:hypothetical protein
LGLQTDICSLIQVLRKFKAMKKKVIYRILS